MSKKVYKYYVQMHNPARGHLSTWEDVYGTDDLKDAQGVFDVAIKQLKSDSTLRYQIVEKEMVVRMITHYGN